MDGQENTITDFNYFKAIFLELGYIDSFYFLTDIISKDSIMPILKGNPLFQINDSNYFLLNRICLLYKEISKADTVSFLKITEINLEMGLDPSPPLQGGSNLTTVDQEYTYCLNTLTLYIQFQLQAHQFSSIESSLLYLILAHVLLSEKNRLGSKKYLIESVRYFPLNYDSLSLLSKVLTSLEDLEETFERLNIYSDSDPQKTYISFPNLESEENKKIISCLFEIAKRVISLEYIFNNFHRQIWNCEEVENRICSLEKSLKEFEKVPRNSLCSEDGNSVLELENGYEILNLYRSRKETVFGNYSKALEILKKNSLSLGLVEKTILLFELGASEEILQPMKSSLEEFLYSEENKGKGVKNITNKRIKTSNLAETNPINSVKKVNFVRRTACLERYITERNLFLTGLYYLSLKDTVSAIYYLKELHSSNPSFPYVAFYLAQTYLLKRDIATALFYLKGCQETLFSLGMLYSAAGKMYFEDGKPDVALCLYKEALKRTLMSPRIWIAIADCYAQLGDFENADESLQKIGEDVDFGLVLKKRIKVNKDLCKDKEAYIWSVRALRRLKELFEYKKDAKFALDNMGLSYEELENIAKDIEEKICEFSSDKNEVLELIEYCRAILKKYESNRALILEE